MYLGFFPYPLFSSSSLFSLSFFENLYMYRMKLPSLPQPIPHFFLLPFSFLFYSLLSPLSAAHLCTGSWELPSSFQPERFIQDKGLGHVAFSGVSPVSSVLKLSATRIAISFQSRVFAWANGGRKEHSPVIDSAVFKLSGEWQSLWN